MVRDWTIDGLCRLLQASQAELRWHAGRLTKRPDAVAHQQVARSLIRQIDHAVEKQYRCLCCGK